jgi:hypothetical protein
MGKMVCGNWCPDVDGDETLLFSGVITKCGGNIIRALRGRVD